MAITSAVSICNLALSNLGNYGTIDSITTPVNDKELTFAARYDICRKTLLKTVMPNFALARVVVSRKVTTPPFGYGYYYEYPNSCLKVLGIGDVPDKINDYSIENDGTGLAILTDTDATGGLEVRYILDVEDVTQFSPDFITLFGWQLAADCCLDITQSEAKAAALQESMSSRYSALSGMQAQENRPIRISHSRFKASRYSWDANYTGKR
jgi:hypothetical protein